MLEGISLLLIGWIVGAIGMYVYLTWLLHRSGWSWKLLVGKIVEDEMHKKVMKELEKPYKPLTRE